MTEVNVCYVFLARCVVDVFNVRIVEGELLEM